ncbi:MAG: hypothetical protein RL417_476 [Pseudomonadota bacterium]|jgi:F0F1-type ATP synthase assembly protein I
MLIKAALATPIDLLRAGSTVFTSFRLLRWCLLPWLVGLLVSLAAFTLIFTNRAELPTILGLETGGLLESLVVFAGVGLGAGLAALMGYGAALLAGGIFFEFLIEEFLLLHGHPPAQSRTVSDFIGRFIRGAFEDIVILALLLVLGACALLSSLIPPLAFLSGVFSAVVFGFELIDKPLVALGARLGKRVSTVRGHLFETGVLGALGGGVALIPFANLVALPLLYVVATERVIKWEEVKALR